VARIARPATSRQAPRRQYRLRPSSLKFGAGKAGPCRLGEEGARPRHGAVSRTSYSSNVTLDIAGVFAVLTPLAGLGITLHLTMQAVQRRVIFWAQPEEVIAA